jgi:hypothetical protein
MDLETSVANFQRVLRGATPPVEDKQRHLNDIKTVIHTAFKDIEVSTKPHGNSHVKADEVRHALQVSFYSACTVEICNNKCDIE